MERPATLGTSALIMGGIKVMMSALDKYDMKYEALPFIPYEHIKRVKIARKPFFLR